jgi:hypothetical protein
MGLTLPAYSPSNDLVLKKAVRGPSSSLKVTTEVKRDTEAEPSHQGERTLNNAELEPADAQAGERAETPDGEDGHPKSHPEDGEDGEDGHPEDIEDGEGKARLPQRRRRRRGAQLTAKRRSMPRAFPAEPPPPIVNAGAQVAPALVAPPACALPVAHSTSGDATVQADDTAPAPSIPFSNGSNESIVSAPNCAPETASTVPKKCAAKCGFFASIDRCVSWAEPRHAYPVALPEACLIVSDAVCASCPSVTPECSADQLCSKCATKREAEMSAWHGALSKKRPRVG